MKFRRAMASNRPSHVMLGNKRCNEFSCSVEVLFVNWGSFLQL